MFLLGKKLLTFSCHAQLRSFGQCSFGAALCDSMCSLKCSCCMFWTDNADETWVLPITPQLHYTLDLNFFVLFCCLSWSVLVLPAVFFFLQSPHSILWPHIGMWHHQHPQFMKLSVMFCKETWCLWCSLEMMRCCVFTFSVIDQGNYWR